MDMHKQGIQFFPDDLDCSNNTAPQIYITGIAIAEKDTTLFDGMSLSHNHNNIRIDFIGLAYSSRGRFAYRYRLVGLDSIWVNSDSRNSFARFPSLPPGNYTFEVIAMNEDGLASVPAQFHFNINKPFWQAWWFYSIILLIAFITLGILYKMRMKVLEKRNNIIIEKSKSEQDLRASELTALKAQMNPHFIFNALNSIQEFILLNEKATAQEYLGKFSNLIRLYLDMSQKQSIGIDDEIKTLPSTGKYPFRRYIYL